MDGFEIKAHQGDMAARVWAGSLEGVFVQAARAMVAIVTDAVIAQQEERAISLAGEDPEGLLVGFLNELLFLLETEGWLPGAVEVTLRDGGRALAAKGRGERLDPLRHPIERVIKAATHHALEIQEKDGLFQAEIVFDL